MEKHKCKLCARTFSNGRALGGHMKGHLATHPLPPKTTHSQHHQLGRDRDRDRTRTDSAASSSSSSSGDELETQQQGGVNKEVAEEKSLVYGLRENPKKSLRFADPEFSFAADSGCVVQDRESETESRNPTRRRSKRNRKVGNNTITTTPTNDIKKLKLLGNGNPSSVESPTEPEPVSSVSDTSPDEDVAMCLMMLSRDVWRNNTKSSAESLEEESEEIALNNKKIIPGKHHCGKCKKLFRSHYTLDEHKRVCWGTKVKGKTTAAAVVADNDKIFECPFCYRVFGSGQALGGHKRSHLLAAAASSNAASSVANSIKFENNLIDLNLPAPLEDDEFSVVSDA